LRVLSAHHLSVPGLTKTSRKNWGDRNLKREQNGAANLKARIEQGRSGKMGIISNGSAIQKKEPSLPDSRRSNKMPNGENGRRAIEKDALPEYLSLAGGNGVEPSKRTHHASSLTPPVRANFNYKQSLGVFRKAR